MTHHSVMTSSLPIKILKIDKFDDLSCDIDYNNTDVFRDVISLIINQCGPRLQSAPSSDTLYPPTTQCNQTSIYHFSCRILNMKSFEQAIT